MIKPGHQVVAECVTCGEPFAYIQVKKPRLTCSIDCRRKRENLTELNRRHALRARDRARLEALR